MSRDKKSAGGLTLVLDGPHGVEPVREIRPALVLEALGSLR